MSKPWVLVTPASRGLGAAVARHVLRTTTLPVLATCRTEAATEATRATLLRDAAGDAAGRRLSVVPLDVTDEASVAAAAARAGALFPPGAGGWHLRLAFALPGVLHPEKSPAQVQYNAALETLRVNTLGPLVLMKWFGDLLPAKGAAAADPTPARSSSSFRLPAHATWLTASARVGSTADNRLGGWYSYRASKAGVASLTKTFDLHLRQRCGDRALAMAYHPGTVRTDLSRAFWANVREDKLFSPEYAAERLFDVVARRTLADRGRVWDWKGEEVPP